MSMKVLFIGLGGIGQRHLRNLISMKPDTEIYALRKRREQIVLNDKLQPIAGESLEKKYHIHNVKTLEEAYEKGIDTVFICNPSSMHMDFLLASLNYGWNVFVEKPLSHNLNKLEKLQLLLENTTSTSMIGFQNRFHPCIKKAKELLDKKVVGNICFINAEVGENVTKWHPFEDYHRMYACKKELGGGVILSQIHELDYLYYLLGMPQTIYTAGGKLSNLDIDVEDIAEILMTFQSNDRVFPVHVHEDYLQSPPSRKCKIQGTEGLMTFDLMHSNLALYDGDGKCIYKEDFCFERNDMFLDEMNDFLTNITLCRSSSIPVKEGIQSLKIAIMAQKSMETGRVIQIGETE